MGEGRSRSFRPLNALGAPAWLAADASGALLITLHIQPGARRTEIVGLHGDALKIRVAAPPVEGKANEQLVAFLAGALGVAKSQVEVVAGATGRRKRVRVVGATPQAAERLVQG